MEKISKTIDKYSKVAGHKINVKNPLYFCILTIKFQNKELKKQFLLQFEQQQQNKIPSNKCKESEVPVQ